MSRLGLLLLRGNGVSELGDSVYDNAEAVKWLRAGAKGGSFEAQTLLGLAYFKMKLYSKAQQVRPPPHPPPPPHPDDVSIYQIIVSHTLK